MSTQTRLETFAPPDTAIEHKLDGWKSSIPAVLRENAEKHPERPLALQRAADDHWTGVTYGDARAKADAIAQALLDLNLSAERPLMILSGNSVEHLLLSLGAYTAG